MVIHALEDQRRGNKLGEIRVGTTLKNQDGSAGRPISLEKFRITTKLERIANKVADLFGGSPTPTTLRDGEKTIEVLTETADLPVTVLPREAIMVQFRELWKGGICQRRCDSIKEFISQSPCKCPADEDERRQAVKDGDACKDVTRLSLMLPDVALGTWRFVTGSINAALELSDSTDVLEAAKDQNIWLPATFSVRQRVEKKLENGKPTTKKFVVCSLVPDHSPREIASGQIASGFMGSLPSPTSLALESGSTTCDDTVPALEAQHSVDALASSFQKNEIRRRQSTLPPPKKVEFDNWLRNEMKVKGRSSWAHMLASDVPDVVRKLDLLTGQRTPGAWDEDDEVIDAEIVHEGTGS